MNLVAYRAHGDKAMSILENPTFKWHDVGLPWFVAARRGHPPTEKAWRQLAREVDLRLLCIFMVADRSDAPGGWRRNGPTLWFHEQARSRGLVSDLELDLPDHPSLISVGSVLVREGAAGRPREVLLVRSSSEEYGFPTGAIEWDESPGDAARRHVRDQLGVGVTPTESHLGDVDRQVAAGERRVLERVRFYLLRAAGTVAVRGQAREGVQGLWVAGGQLDSISWATPNLRALALAALEG